MDVKTTFLMAILMKRFTWNNLKDFFVVDKFDHVYRLKKALYDLKQAP
jgi:hypothetical protein